MKTLTYGIFSLLSLLTTTAIYAQEGEMPPPEQSMWQPIIMIGIALMFFYFILWRPEQKRRKALEDQRSGLQKGDRVTAMGILGTVLRVQDQTVILKMYDGAKIEVLKGAITDILQGSEPGSSEEKSE